MSALTDVGRPKYSPVEWPHIKTAARGSSPRRMVTMKYQLTGLEISLYGAEVSSY
jgi:hypothetical protein